MILVKKIITDNKDDDNDSNNDDNNVLSADNSINDGGDDGGNIIIYLFLFINQLLIYFDIQILRYIIYNTCNRWISSVVIATTNNNHLGL